MAKRITTEEFINKAHELYGNLYDYSKTDCENRDEKGRVCIICHKLDKNGKEHGEFWQRPYSHLSGMKCKKCADEETGKLNSKKFAKTTEQFIKEATEVHGNKYSYENVNYVNSHTLVNITCKIHGGFMQSPTNHLQGKGCPKCANKNVTSGEFIEKARKVHGNKYDYSKVKYINNQANVCIICPEHGEFWQAPGSHLSGKGCPHCLSSKIEDTIETKLNEINVNFEKQKTFDWLKSKRNMRLDFYLPEYNIAIECQGKQHFDNIEYFGGNDGLKYRKYNDMIKLKLCKEHNINLLYFNYDDDINEFEQKLKEYGIH